LVFRSSAESPDNQPVAYRTAIASAVGKAKPPLNATWQMTRCAGSSICPHPRELRAVYSRPAEFDQTHPEISFLELIIGNTVRPNLTRHLMDSYGHAIVLSSRGCPIVPRRLAR
jgi:hypothetical protein